MSDGLYLMRLEQKKDARDVVMFSVLTICLYDGAAEKASIAGLELAETIYEHFRSLADHGIRDSFVDGVLMGLRVAGEVCHANGGPGEGSCDFILVREP
tara:strand:+ start:401 stop:697 length:297 start_codon:yes stop_codon:yes gene_type:complete